jgi:hypothetical protein
LCALQLGEQLQGLQLDSLLTLEPEHSATAPGAPAQQGGRRGSAALGKTSQPTHRQADDHAYEGDDAEAQLANLPLDGLARHGAVRTCGSAPRGSSGGGSVVARHAAPAPLQHEP